LNSLPGLTEHKLVLHQQTAKLAVIATDHWKHPQKFDT